QLVDALLQRRDLRVELHGLLLELGDAHVTLSELGVALGELGVLSRERGLELRDSLITRVGRHGDANRPVSRRWKASRGDGAVWTACARSSAPVTLRATRERLDEPRGRRRTSGAAGAHHLPRSGIQLPVLYADRSRINVLRLGLHVAKDD